MATLRVVCQSSLSPERVTAAARDFSERRPEVFPAVQLDRLVVHSQGDQAADVTEGTRFGPFVNWERCDYDWSRSGLVVADVTDSNIYEPQGSSWEIAATPADGGSEVVMTWNREFKRTPKGRLFGFVFNRFGQRIFEKYGAEIVENLERLDEAG
jgi:hypothetical protein